MKVVALDPGGTTGIAWLHVREDGTLVHSAGEREPLDTLYWLDELLHDRRFRPDVIVCERFVITGATMRMTRQNDALEIIGAVRWIAHRAQVEFDLQDPATAKRMVTNQRLRDLGLWVRGLDHARDATRHAVLAAVTRGGYDLILNAGT